MYCIGTSEHNEGHENANCLGSVDIPLSSLPNLSEQDEWYVLGAAKGQGKAGPSARIKVKFMVINYCINLRSNAEALVC